MCCLCSQGAIIGLSQAIGGAEADWKKAHDLVGGASGDKKLNIAKALLASVQKAWATNPQGAVPHASVADTTSGNAMATATAPPMADTNSGVAMAAAMGPAFTQLAETLSTAIQDALPPAQPPAAVQPPTVSGPTVPYAPPVGSMNVDMNDQVDLLATAKALKAELKIRQQLEQDKKEEQKNEAKTRDTAVEVADQRPNAGPDAC